MLRTVLKRQVFETLDFTAFGECIEEKELSEHAEISCLNIETKEYLNTDENLCTDETNEDIRTLVSRVEMKTVKKIAYRVAKAVKKRI